MSGKTDSKKTPVGKESVTKLWFIPLIIAIIAVPLITVVHVYHCGLEENPWFSIGGKLNDFFLYYKAFFLRLIGVVALFSLAYLIPFEDHGVLKNKKTIAPTIAIGVFGLFSLLSAILAKHKTIAFFGGYEQFEGWFILLAYVACFYLAFGFLRTKELICFILDVLLIGATAVGILGTFQAMGLDWIQSDWAKPFITAELMGNEGFNADRFNIKLNFDRGMSYVTLYNPNYVGSYVSLVLPYIGFIILKGEKIWRRILAGVCAVLLMITLIASRSLTGVLGLMVGMIVGAILLIPYMKKAKPIVITGLALLVAGAAVIVILQPAFISKLFDRHEQYNIETMTSEGSDIKIHTGSGKDITVTANSSDNDGELKSDEPIDALIKVTDGSGKDISVSKSDDSRALTVDESGVEPLKFSFEKKDLDARAGATYLSELERVTGTVNEVSVTSEDLDALIEPTTINLLHVTDWDYDWTFTLIGGNWYIYNNFGRLDKLSDIKKCGFEGSYYFASRRGYIWSRTIPLLSDYLLTGAGADHFVYVFPNDDYVGKRYMGYDTQTITKPHDMFLQIWVQDGLPALLAFLFLYILFMIRAFKLCMKKEKKQGCGMVIVTAIATTAYMVVGLANDSTITVAVIYWIMLGAGYAAEREATR